MSIVMPPAGGEQQVLLARTHVKVLVPAVAAVVALVAVMVFGAGRVPSDTTWAGWNRWAPRGFWVLVFVGFMTFVVWPVVVWWTTTFEVTSTRVRSQWGVFYRYSRSVQVDRITQVEEERGILDRIFGAGTLVIYDAASNAAALRFVDMPRIHEVKQLIDDVRAAHSTNVAVVRDSVGAWGVPPQGYVAGGYPPVGYPAPPASGHPGYPASGTGPVPASGMAWGAQGGFGEAVPYSQSTASSDYAAQYPEG